MKHCLQNRNHAIGRLERGRATKMITNDSMTEEVGSWLSSNQVMLRHLFLSIFVIYYHSLLVPLSTSTHPILDFLVNHYGRRYDSDGQGWFRQRCP